MPSSPLTSSRGLIVCGLLFSMAAGAADSSKTRQAAILGRVLSYELTLNERAGSRVGVAVVYLPGDASSERNAQDWYAAFQELTSLKVKDRPFFAMKVPYSPNALAAAIDSEGVDLVLVADGLAAQLGAISAVTRAKRVLSASNDVAYTQKDLSVCVADQDGKLKVVINLTAADREKIQFSSNLLRLAKIVR